MCDNTASVPSQPIGSTIMAPAAYFAGAWCTFQLVHDNSPRYSKQRRHVHGHLSVGPNMAHMAMAVHGGCIVSFGSLLLRSIIWRDLRWRLTAEVTTKFSGSISSSFAELLLLYDVTNGAPASSQEMFAPYFHIINYVLLVFVIIFKKFWTVVQAVHNLEGHVIVLANQIFHWQYRERAGMALSTWQEKLFKVCCWDWQLRTAWPLA